MNKIRHYLFAALLLTTACLQAAPVITVDWKDFMSRQDLTWDKLPEHWYDAAFLGNGMQGLLVYKQPGKNFIRLETGSYAVHDHREANDLFGKPRLLTGYFSIHPKGEILRGTMHLDLWNAEATADIVTSEGSIRLTAWVHADDEVMVTKIATEGGEKDFEWKWTPAPSESPRYVYAQTEAGKWITLPQDYPLNPKPVVEQTATGGMSLQKLHAGGETAVGWTETTSGKERVFWMNVSHTYPQENAVQRCRETLAKAARKGYGKEVKTHRKWWHSYYPCSFLTLSDKAKEKFYWIQMYKLASATRGNRGLIDCTGPWLTVTPWPNAWWNLNIQLTYWPLNTSNRLALAGSLENALYNNLDQLRLNVPEPYRYDSFGIGRSSNDRCRTTEIGIPGVSELAEVGSLTWACHNLWLIYRHKMDDNLLRDKLFPLLKGAINYYLHFLRREADGKLHLPRTYSPEYGSADDCNYDLQLLRWGCETLLQAAERLHIDDPLAARWKEVLSDLTPFPTDANGLLIGREAPYTVSHRHYSHLLAIYPLYLINKDNDRQLIETSLRHWQGKTGAHLGYSLTGASSISSALGKGNDALMYLDRLFGRFLSPTTMYRESGPVIETPLSAAQSIHDMLLQSWGGKIRVFPAVPDAWTDVTFDRFLAEGAFEVSAVRRQGKTEYIRLKSLAGEPCVLETEKGTYPINLKKGEEVVIYQ